MKLDKKCLTKLGMLLLLVIVVVVYLISKRKSENIRENFLSDVGNLAEGTDKCYYFCNNSKIFVIKKNDLKHYWKFSNGTSLPSSKLEGKGTSMSPQIPSDIKIVPSADINIKYCVSGGNITGYIEISGDVPKYNKEKPTSGTSAAKISTLKDINNTITYCWGKRYSLSNNNTLVVDSTSHQLNMGSITPTKLHALGWTISSGTHKGNYVTLIIIDSTHKIVYDFSFKDGTTLDSSITLTGSKALSIKKIYDIYNISKTGIIDSPKTKISPPGYKFLGSS